MDYQWIIETYGDPLGKVRDLIKEIWLQAGLAGILVSMSGENRFSTASRILTDRTSVNGINPFKPLMEINIARLIPGLLADHPSEKLGAIIRPCEMRALLQMIRLASINLDQLFTISIDCLGTLPADEYQWRLERIEKSSTKIGKLPVYDDELTDESLNFARQGGIIPYRYRTACQVCLSPAADHANINIHILGLPVRQVIIVSASDTKTAETINLGKFSAGLADHILVAQHERVVAAICERDERRLEQVNEELRDMLPANVDAFIDQLDDCGDCQICMDDCPICLVNRPDRDSHGHYNRSSVIRWLVSCAGCGMCEQACPKHLPLPSIFAHIRQQLDQVWEKDPGEVIN